MMMTVSVVVVNILLLTFLPPLWLSSLYFSINGSLLFVGRLYIVFAFRCLVLTCYYYHY